MTTFKFQTHQNQYLFAYLIITHKQKNMTQNELSEITGFSHEYIRKLESSKYCGGLSLDSLYVISKALNVPISKFMESNYEI